ncbi:hypothetical protein, partial [Escherichia coli]|uniref:hypothetical protein n=1 Tax=Escherichia coli TaxID=562 RepID=UPI0019531CA9
VKLFHFCLLAKHASTGPLKADNQGNLIFANAFMMSRPGMNRTVVGVQIHASLGGRPVLLGKRGVELTGPLPSSRLVGLSKQA